MTVLTDPTDQPSVLRGPPDASTRSRPWLGGHRVTAVPHHPSPSLDPGALAPLTKLPAKLSVALPDIRTIKQYPLGALSGFVLAGWVHVVRPDLTPDEWYWEGPYVLMLVSSGMLIERSLGWLLDPFLEHIRAQLRARLEERRLRGFERKGALTRSEAKDIEARIARRAVAGDVKRTGPRGPYKRKGDGAPPAPPAAASPPRLRGLNPDTH